MTLNLVSRYDQNKRLDVSFDSSLKKHTKHMAEDSELTFRHLWRHPQCSIWIRWKPNVRCMQSRIWWHFFSFLVKKKQFKWRIFYFCRKKENKTLNINFPRSKYSIDPIHKLILHLYIFFTQIVNGRACKNIWLIRCSFILVQCAHDRNSKSLK